MGRRDLCEREDLTFYACASPCIGHDYLQSVRYGSPPLRAHLHLRVDGARAVSRPLHIPLPDGTPIAAVRADGTVVRAGTARRISGSYDAIVIVFDGSDGAGQ